MIFSSNLISWLISTKSELGLLSIFPHFLANLDDFRKKVIVAIATLTAIVIFSNNLNFLANLDEIKIEISKQIFSFFG